MPAYTVAVLQEDSGAVLDLQIVTCKGDVDAGGCEKKAKRHRVSRPDQWKRNIRKEKKNFGLEHRQVNGDVAAEKQMGPACTCQFGCFKQIGETNCQKLFSNFWKLGDYSLQNAYLAGCVRITRPKKAKQGSRVNFSRCFYVNVNGIDTEICKQAFLNLHAVSNGRLDRVLKKKQQLGNSGLDARGRHGVKPNRISDEDKREVHKSIDDFRKFAGYDTLRSNFSEIIPAPYTAQNMYINYCQELESEGKSPVSEYRYKEILRKDYNLQFAEKHKKDTRKPSISFLTPSQTTAYPPQHRSQLFNEFSIEDSFLSEYHPTLVEALRPQIDPQAMESTLLLLPASRDTDSQSPPTQICEFSSVTRD